MRQNCDISPVRRRYLGLHGDSEGMSLNFCSRRNERNLWLGLNNTLAKP